jgi:uncharacterized RDD family membrane protein YckC
MKTTITKSDTLSNSQFAGLAKRVKAFAFDYILISGYIVLLAAATMVTIKAAGLLGLSLRWPENPFLADLLALFTLVLPVILYFTWSESSSRQATWGKGKAGIRVVNAHGGALTRTQAFIRSLVKLLPWQIAHTCIFHIPGWPLAVTVLPPAVIAGYVLLFVLVGIYVATSLISRQHRTPYDWAAGSYVIIEK